MKRGRCLWMGGLVVLAGLSDGCVPSDLVSGPDVVGHNDIVTMARRCVNDLGEPLIQLTLDATRL